VSFAAITLCVASQLFIVVVYFVIDSVRKPLDTLSYIVSAGECRNQLLSYFRDIQQPKHHLEYRLQDCSAHDFE